MKSLDRIVAGAIAGIGLLHIGVTPIAFSELNRPALWFASGGLAMLFGAALNLLRSVYGQTAPGLRWVSLAANLCMLAFAAVMASLDRARLFSPQALILFSLLLAATLFSMARPAGAVGRHAPIAGRNARERA